jgi:hypothetical protein
MSLGEIMMKPTAMLYRNLLSMETEVVALRGLLSRVPQGIREGKVRNREDVVDGSETARTPSGACYAARTLAKSLSACRTDVGHCVS